MASNTFCDNTMPTLLRDGFSRQLQLYLLKFLFTLLQWKRSRNYGRADNLNWHDDSHSS